MYLNLETVARGLGFTDNKNGVEYVRWNVVRAYLADLKFSQEVAKDTYIPEKIFHRLVCAACADANASLMGVQGVRLRFFFQILCGCAGKMATADARVKCAHKGKALLHADFGQRVGSATFFGGYFSAIVSFFDFFAFFGGFSISNFQIIYIYIIKFDINFDSNQHFSRLVLICLHERQSLVLLGFF